MLLDYPTPFPNEISLAVLKTDISSFDKYASIQYFLC